MLVYQRIVLREPSRTKKNSTLCRLSTWVHGRRVFFFPGHLSSEKNWGYNLLRWCLNVQKFGPPDLDL